MQDVDPTERSDTALFKKIRSLVAERTNAKLDELNSETRLCHDLGLTGDDAEEFILVFQREFGVNMTGFAFDDYFAWEISIFAVLNPFYWLLCLDPSFRRQITAPRNKKGDIKLIPLKLSDLVAAAASKQWPNLSGRPRE